MLSSKSKARQPRAEKLRFSRAEAAEYLGFTKGTLEKWACYQTPRLPYYRIGGKAIYDKVDLDEFLARHRIEQPEVA